MHSMIQAAISPSMMCVDFSDLKETIRTFERKDIDFLHIDIMDGEFVPNFTLGVDFCNKIREMTHIPLDLHLMIEKPENKLDWFAPCEGEILSVHAESTAHLQRVLTKIHSFHAKAYVALNPATSISVLENILDDLDGVLVMTVNPGFAGQKLVNSTIPKITRLRDFLDSRGYEHISIEVDGNVSFENAAVMRAAGADVFVAGSSSVFSKDAHVENNIDWLRHQIMWEDTGA